MQPISTYATSDAHLRLLLQGPPKSGKTSLACQFPKPYVIDLDVNLRGALQHLRDLNLPLPVGYDRVEIKDGKLVDMSQRYILLNNLMIAAGTDPSVETIIIDSATMLSDIMIAEVLRQQGKAEMSIQLWGFFYQLGKKFCSALSNYRKHIVLIAHERFEKDESSGLHMFRIAWPGQLGDIIGAFFTDVWRCEVSPTAGVNPTYKWVVRTMPDHRVALGNSLKLPPTFEFSWAEVEKRLKGGKA